HELAKNRVDFSKPCSSALDPRREVRYRPAAFLSLALSGEASRGLRLCAGAPAQESGPHFLWCWSKTKACRSPVSWGHAGGHEPEPGDNPANTEAGRGGGWKGGQGWQGQRRRKLVFRILLASGRAS